MEAGAATNCRYVSAKVDAEDSLERMLIRLMLRSFNAGKPFSEEFAQKRVSVLSACFWVFVGVGRESRISESQRGPV